MNNFDLATLGVMIDMAGCPNRCRHCWLGSHRNGNMSAEQFKDIATQIKNWRDENGRGIGALTFWSWWREPDYRDDYRELWELEKELSSPGRTQRFELLSTWRLARDESYAPWAAALPTKACQITFFGMEKNTDWFMRRRGAFRDQLLATERLLAAGVAPRWQLFPTKRCLDELDEFFRLIEKMDLWRRCEKIGQHFEIFLNSASPEGSGYEMEELRLEQADLDQIPRELIARSRGGLGPLGRPERELISELLADMNPPGIDVPFPSVAVDADLNVTPNVAEPTAWWRLGNLKTDGVDKILKAFRDGTTPGLTAIRTIPVCELARRYGDPESEKLYTKGDLVSRFLHQWGEDYLKGKSL